MCLVLDINSFHCVFNKESDSHEQFKPVYDWIINGSGKLVFGGTKYEEEISKLAKYRRLLAQLNKLRKIVRVSDEKVDQRELAIKQSCPDPDFDDPHLVALLSVSGCKIFCSEDERSYKYIKRREWYTNGIPKIYRARSFSRASSLLADKNMVGICLPCRKLTKNERELFQ